MKVLLIEDDASVADGIIDGLSAAHFETHHVTTGQAGIESVSTFTPDIVLLDLGLPDIDGTDVCRVIRSQSHVPIIVVSARGAEIDRVLALEIGADDYMVKPFGMRELVARIKAVARRMSSVEEQVSPEASRIYGPLEIDSRTRKVVLSGEEIHLTAKEFDLLEYLSQDPGLVHKRSDILHDVWETNWYGTTKTLDAHIASIRKKLKHPDWIESVRGVGFRFGIPE